MFDPSKPVQTRDGRKARIICTDRRNGGELEIVALVECDGYESVASFSSNGQYLKNHKGDYDLVNVPVRTSTFQNLYEKYCASKAYNEPACFDTAGYRFGKPVGRLRRDYDDGVFVSAEFEPIE